MNCRGKRRSRDLNPSLSAPCRPLSLSGCCCCIWISSCLATPPLVWAQSRQPTSALLPRPRSPHSSLEAFLSVPQSVTVALSSWGCDCLSGRFCSLFCCCCCQIFLCSFLSPFLAGPFAHEQKAPPGFSPWGGAELGILLLGAWGFLWKKGGAGGEHPHMRPILGTTGAIAAFHRAPSLRGPVVSWASSGCHGVSFAKAQAGAAGRGGASPGEGETASVPGWAGRGHAMSTRPDATSSPLLPASPAAGLAPPRKGGPTPGEQRGDCGGARRSYLSYSTSPAVVVMSTGNPTSTECMKPLISWILLLGVRCVERDPISRRFEGTVESTRCRWRAELGETQQAQRNHRVGRCLRGLGAPSEIPGGPSWLCLWLRDLAPLRAPLSFSVMWAEQ